MFGAKSTKEFRARFASVPVAPDIVVGSAIVDGDPPVWTGSIVIHKPGDARRVVDEIKEGGADFVKRWSVFLVRMRFWWSEARVRCDAGGAIGMVQRGKEPREKGFALPRGEPPKQGAANIVPASSKRSLRR
jgi:hypothetical protein